MTMIRRAAALSIATAAALVLAACSGGAESDADSTAQPDAVVVAHAAGVNGEAVEALLADFTAETGIPASGLTYSDADYGAKMQLAARSGRAEFDVALGVTPDVFTVTRDSGIYQPVDTSAWAADDVSALRDADLLGEDYVVSQQTAALLVTPAGASGPTTWAEFFDVDAFPGNRGLPAGGIGVPITLEYASIAEGTDPEQLYPVDIDAAVDTVGALGDATVLWDNAPKAIQDVVAGDTAMTFAYAPAVLAAMAAGAPIQASAPAGTAVTEQYGVAVDAGPNGVRAANVFLDWWFRTDTQVAYSAGTGYGIVVPSARVLDALSDEQKAYLPFAGPQPENFHVLDYGYYSETVDGDTNLARTLERWNEFRAQ